MIARGENFKKYPLNIAGSSTFGRYKKISDEKTVNMFLSDGWLVDYAGYMAVNFGIVLGTEGRAIHTSTKLGKLFAVISENVWMLDVSFDQLSQTTINAIPVLIGRLESDTGVVYITENNKPQVVISDGVHVYFYDPTQTPSFQIATQDGGSPGIPISFTPGYIDFHDTYILCAASNDTYLSVNPSANNTWRLGIIDPSSGKLIFPNNPSGISYVGLIQTKPDNTQAIVRFPSKGNMIFVLGNIVGEPWFDTGAQLFPYQRTNQFNIDYGCINPATVAAIDEVVVWLAQNEKSGPIIVYTTGGAPKKITTDGIDYLFSQLSNPADSQAFLYRQDGHLIYHINFYTDNLSLFYDFNTEKFFHATDENGDYFIAAQVAFFNNQYYFVSKNNGNIYAFDTIFTTYDGKEIPRQRICGHMREKDQQYRVFNDVGFTIEQGDNNPQPNGISNLIIINGGSGYSAPVISFVGGNGLNAAATATVTGGVITGITITNPGFNYTYPPDVIITDSTGTGATIVSTLTDTAARVDLSISRDGGQSYGNNYPYILNPDGRRLNRLMWWNLGIANDLVYQFNFYGLGRFIAYDGEANVRQ